MIETAKKMHWDEFLQSVNDKSIWIAHRYASGDPSDGGKTRVPTLNLGRREDGTTKTAASNEEKDKAFTESFFPTSGPVTQSNDYYKYPPPKFPFSPITNPQIARAISRISPHKAPGLDGIPNSIYSKCSNLLVPHLGPIYQATFNVSVYPKEWQD